MTSFKELCGKSSTEAEVNFNLLNFLETLIAMDRQHQAWLQRRKVQQDQDV